MNLGISEKIALITGSYRGTGSGIASSLALEGAEVVIHGFHSGEAAKVVQEITAEGGKARSAEADLFTDAGIRSLKDQVGHVDILINNYGKPAESSWDSYDNWSEEWERNVLLGVKVAQNFIGGMKDRNWGRVIFVGTAGVDKPSNHSPGYYAAKASLHAIVRTLAMEVRGTGVTANLINPGMIATEEVKEMLTRAAKKRDLSTDWESVEKWAATDYVSNLTARIPNPIDIGKIVTFLSGEPAWYINGASIAVDGGSVDA